MLLVRDLQLRSVDEGIKRPQKGEAEGKKKSKGNGCDESCFDGLGAGLLTN